MSPSRRPYNAAQLFTEQLSTRDLAPEPGTSTTTSYSGHDYYNNGTRIQPISRAIHPSDAQRPNSYIALDRSNRRPEPPVISDLTSWTSQRSGGSKPDSATPTCPPLPSAAHPTYEMGFHGSRNHSTQSNTLDASSSSHIRPGNFPPSLRRNEPQAFAKVPDSSHHNLDQYREITFDFDRTSATSTQSQSSRPSTRASVLSSTLSVAATSMTSFSSGPSRIGAPKLDLEIPSHSLFVDNPPLSSFSQGPGNRMRTSTSLNWDQEILRQTAENSTLPPSNSIYNNLSRHLQACSIEHTTSSLDQNQGISRPPEASPQISPIRIRFLQDSTPIEQAIRSRLPTFHFVDGVVTSGTLEGLVWFLISGSGRRGHNYYRDTFLTACSELTIPEDLFQILSRRMSEEVNTSNDGFGRQYTIFLIVKHWLRSNIFPPNEELLSRIKVFCEDAIRRYPSLETIAKEACQLTIDAKMTRPTADPHPDEPILDSSQLKPSDLAVALGLLEGDNYKALQPSDYLLYLTKDQSGDRVKIYHETNEKIRLWVIRSILHFDTVSNRSEVMKFFILTALECHSMRNFSSTVAISRALHSVSVESLKATRKALSKKTQAKLPALYDIINPLSSHRGYYAAIHGEAATESKRNTCIPWLPVHFKELNRLGAVREPVTVQVGGHHLVNFNRYNRFMDF